MQHYTCAACGVEWSRPTARGRVPKLCPQCRETGRSKRLAACAWCGHMAFIRFDADCCSRQCSMNMRAIRWCRVPWCTCLVCMAWFTTKPHRYETCSPACQAIATEALESKRQPEARECRRCSAEFMTRQPAAQVCSLRCQRKEQRLRRRVRESGSNGQWRWSDFMRIAAKFDYCCAYCGVKPDRLDPDHVIPLSKQGPNTTSNLLPACASCNCDKRDLDLDAWLADRERRELPPVKTTWDDDDPRYWHLTHLPRLAAA